MGKVAGIVAALATFWLAGSATALTLGFEDHDHGDIVAGEAGVLITTENFNEAAGHPDIGVAFDSSLITTEDPDLELGSGWASGNLARDTFLGNLLIVQENDDCDLETCATPDDEGRRPAGLFRFDLGVVGTFTDFSFDLVDVESITAENGSVEFRLAGAQIGFYEFAEFVALGQDVVFGDNSANRVDLGTVGRYDEVVIRMGGSGAVDNLVMTLEPASAALLGLGLLGLAVAGRGPGRLR